MSPERQVVYKGERVTLVDILDVKYRCPVCLEIMHTPVQTKCGHRFCEACLNQCRAPQTGRNACPVDKTKLTDKDFFKDAAFHRELEALKVLCVYRSEGCQWIGELRESKEHAEKYCDFVFVRCENNCDSENKIARRLYDLHVREQCPNRILPCRLCKKSLRAIEHEKHLLLDCPQLKTPCGACNVYITRDTMRGHSMVCPNMVVECPFQEFGCEHKCKRNKMSAHRSSSLQLHLEMMAAAYRDVVSKFSDLRIQHFHQMDIMERELQKLRHMHKMMWRVSLPPASVETGAVTVLSPEFYTGKPGYGVQCQLSRHEEGGSQLVDVFVKTASAPPAEDCLPLLARQAYIEGTVQLTIYDTADRVIFNQCCSPFTFGKSSGSPTASQLKTMQIALHNEGPVLVIVSGDAHLKLLPVE